MPTNPRRSVHLWHDIPTGKEPPDLLTVVVEIPKDSQNKYELDKELGLFRLDRVLHSAVHFPGDYGFLPRTLAEDGDPLDVLVIMTVPVFTGCLIETRPVGVFHLVDKGEQDEKVLCVPVRDPWTQEVTDLHHLAKHTLLEIEHFFMIYKDLEGGKHRQQVSHGFGDRSQAALTIGSAMERYVKKFGGAWHG